MATITLKPSQLNNAASQYLTIADQSNMYTDTSSTTYATITNTNASTSNRYIYLKGFDFDSVPTGAEVSAFTVKLKGYYSGGSQQTLYLCNGTTTQTNATATGLTTSTQTRTFANGSLTWSQISGWGDDFGIRINCRRGSRNQTGYYYIYGAEIDVTYTIPTPVSVTGVDVSPSTASIEVGETTTLTATVSPSDASNKTVTWSTSNSAVATVSDGVVTGVSAGSATITATTQDGGYTDTCAVTVTTPTYYDYVQTDTLVDGEEYLLVNGNSGSVSIMSGESGGSGALVAVSGTISNGKLSVTGSTKSRCLFTCEYETSGDSSSAFLKFGNNYLYTDSSSGLRVTAWESKFSGRHWHYKAESKHLLWFFNDASGGSDGYNDTSSTYKYYPEESGGNFTSPYITSPSLADTTTPVVYLFVAAPAASDYIYFKDNGSWVQAAKAYKKVNGSWVEQSDLTQVFASGTNYVKGN